MTGRSRLFYEKVEEAKHRIEEASFCIATPTVAEYCERWLLMQSAHIRTTTLTDYSSKVKNYIVAPLGHMYMVNVTTDDVRLALVAASKKSNSVYWSVHMLYKAIFNSAVDSNIIDFSPGERISAKGGKPQKDKEALTDDQIVKLFSAIKGLPPYAFVMKFHSCCTIVLPNISIVSKDVDFSVCGQRACDRSSYQPFLRAWLYEYFGNIFLKPGIGEEWMPL